MKIAFFTPLNPIHCGVSDYSEELLCHLTKHVDVTVFVDDYKYEGFLGDKNLTVRRAKEFNPLHFDETIYHIANNPYHAYAYTAALKHSGIVVLHEFNLHYLVAAVTIQRGDWDQYLDEAEYNGGDDALAFAKRVRKLEIGPDYDGLAMNRRLLECSKALIVHSPFLYKQVRNTKCEIPIAHIPHGARLLEVNQHRYRSQLGLDLSTPLIGIFGFIKPYKRIEESLRALESLVRIHPQIRVILVGEEHPDFPVRQLLAKLHLEPFVRLLGHVEITEFEQWIGAVDICLNLRYPTYGETSGTLLRAFGLGRAVIVSDVGSFSDFPDNICLKVPIGEDEVELIRRYLALLITRPDVRRFIGSSARDYVANECNWPRVADLYASWIESVAQGTAERDRLDVSQSCEKVESKTVIAKEPSDLNSTDGEGSDKDSSSENDEIVSYLRGLTNNSGGANTYLETHLVRLIHTLEITPPGSAADRILEMGAYMQITPALQHLLGYGEVRGCYLGGLGQTDRREVETADGRTFVCDIDLFNAEKDPFPYEDGYFSTVLCCELLEHLYEDPMHMMAEVNRILAPGGNLILSTPNICSFRAVGAILSGYHPGFFPQYIQPDEWGDVAPRHAREYAPREVQTLFEASGFEVTRFETGAYEPGDSAKHEWVKNLMKRYELPDDLRGEAIYMVGRKVNAVTKRYPLGLYSQE